MPDIPARRPRRVVARTLGFGIGAIAAAGLLAWSPAATSGWNQGAAEATLWQLLNGARVNNGRAPLQQHATLVGLARWRSSDMLAKDYFSHTIEGCGCDVYVYYTANGIAWDWGGENIGWNSGRTDAESPVRVHEQFMTSPGHAANVLNPAFTHGGVGAAAADDQMFLGHVQDTRMYTELFLQAPASAPPPSGGGGSGGGGSGGGGSGGGSAAPTAPTAVAPASPKPKRETVEEPVRPVSTAGIDGVAAVVSSGSAEAMIGRLRADEVAAARAATVAAMHVGKAPTQVLAAGPMEVTAAPVAEPGLLDGLFGAIVGFLFG